jgi:hypothetical protein
LSPEQSARNARANRYRHESTRAKTGNLTEFLSSPRREKECAEGKQRKRRSFFSVRRLSLLRLTVTPCPLYGRTPEIASPNPEGRYARAETARL